MGLFDLVPTPLVVANHAIQTNLLNQMGTIPIEMRLVPPSIPLGMIGVHRFPFSTMSITEMSLLDTTLREISNIAITNLSRTTI